MTPLAAGLLIVFGIFLVLLLVGALLDRIDRDVREDYDGKDKS